MGEFDSDGDVVRGLGMLTLHSAYAEEELDSLLKSLDAIEPFTERVQR